MPATYSLDLRGRVWRACEPEQGTRAEIAERFEVSVSFVRDVRRRGRESGSVAAKPHGGGAPRKADARQDKRLVGLVEARGDDTLAEHAARLAALPGGARLSEATILPGATAPAADAKKRRRSLPTNARANGCRPCAPPTKPRSSRALIRATWSSSMRAASTAL